MANKNQRDRRTGMSIRSILMHPATLFLFTTLVVVVSAISMWNRYRDKIVEVAEFQLTEESIQLRTPPPQWTKSNLKTMLLDQYQKPSTLDPSLVANTADFIRSIGWVEKINEIRKSKSALKIDLTYRHPVAMVKINDTQLLPVDRQGVILDGELIRAVDDAQLLRISMFRPISPNASLYTWQQWPDQRVQEAASIGYVLADHWKQLGLLRIVTFQLPGDRAERQDFQLWTHGQIDPNDVDNRPYAAKVIWGNAPGCESQDEASATAKIQAIDNFIVQRGPLLDSIPNGKLLDVRTGTPILTSQARTADQVRLFSNIR